MLIAPAMHRRAIRHAAAASALMYGHSFAGAQPARCAATPIKFALNRGPYDSSNAPFLHRICFIPLSRRVARCDFAGHGKALWDIDFGAYAANKRVAWTCYSIRIATNTVAATWVKPRIAAARRNCPALAAARSTRP